MHLTPTCTGRRRAIGTTLLASALSLGAVGGAALVALPSTPAAAIHVAADAPNSSALGDLASGALDTLEQAQATRRPALFRKYLATRNDVATRAAGALGIDGEAMRTAWATADLPHQIAVLAALTQLGVPYRSMAMDPGSGFDCSGLTSYAWARAGATIQHQSAAQLNASVPVDRDTAQPGDLVEYPGHVMMYLGVDDAIVHAPYTGKTVELSDISSDSVRFGNPIG